MVPLQPPQEHLMKASRCIGLFTVDAADIRRAQLTPATATSDCTIDPRLLSGKSIGTEKYFSTTAQDGDDSSLVSPTSADDGDGNLVSPISADEDITTFTSAMQDFLDDGAEADIGPGKAVTQQLAATTQPTSRLHGLPNKPLFAHHNVGSTKYFVGSNLCEDPYDALTAGWTEVGLAQRAIQCFSITHPIDTFYRGQAPASGTYDCPLCQVSLSKSKQKNNEKITTHAWSHVYACLLKRALEQGQVEVDLRSSFDQPCKFQYLGNDPTAPPFRACGHKADSWKKFYHHNRNHRIRSERELEIDGVQSRV
jgi:hypothetical protein